MVSYGTLYKAFLVLRISLLLFTLDNLLFLPCNAAVESASARTMQPVPLANSIHTYDSHDGS